MVLHSLVLVFTQSSFNFYTVQFYFFTQSSFIFLHSPVLFFTQSSFIFYTVQFYFFTQSSFIFTQSSFNFYTVQFYFFYTVQFYFYTVNTQSSFIFCVVTRPLSLYCNTCYLTAAILYFLETMDSIIRQVVREELRRKQIRCGWIITKFVFNTNSGPFGVFLKRRPENEDLRPGRGYYLIRA